MADIPSKSSPDPVRWTLCVCGHAEHQHRLTPSGRFVCGFVSRGVTSRGVVGLPYVYECPCENYAAAAKEVPDGR